MILCMSDFLGHVHHAHLKLDYDDAHKMSGNHVMDESIGIC